MTTAEGRSARTISRDHDWWRQAAVYQIYPRSFTDADGGGVGDIAGITSRVPYLASLHIDAVWLSPLYPSPLADGGYDVSDYRDVDERLGTLSDFDALVDSLHASGIRIIIDIVPNHSSHLHPWFQEALAAAPGSAARERYIFRDGVGPGGVQPPSSWGSNFGGPAWTRVPDGQWCLHLFATEQPDFNWDNPEIQKDFLTTLLVLVRPRCRRFPGRRRQLAHQGPLATLPALRRQGARREPAHRRQRPALRPRRRARGIRAVARGAQRVRPSPVGRGRGLGTEAAPSSLRATDRPRAGP